MNKIAYLLFFVASLSYCQEWNTNIDDAKKTANEKGHKIILVFSGSDWCAPCMKLEREIWDSEVFKTYSKEHYTLLKADFPKRKKNALPETLQIHNNKLAEQYNPNGYFPLVVVLDKEGKALGQMGYEKIEPKKYIDKLNAF
ncbi:thioredoxin family protein [uncultured Lacinutrix sp.]|uniref:thioredoxin family protein n=1 Tax=uncultured Lacinutrix sp. TaxID=574032 RepID=UPI00262E059E|nr:thioredoxin family protein [uncultured Lacinutrix sp.]